jgi:SAM-dependent methyltransferase
MKIENSLEFLKHPDSNIEPEFIIKDDFLVDKNTDTKYPIISNMIDFQNSVIVDCDEVKKGLIFKINAIFSNYLDTWIQTSIFAGGGITFVILRRVIKGWIDQVVTDKTLVLDPEEGDQLSYFGSEKCLTVQDFASLNVLPVESFYPNLNAPLEQLPIRSSSFQSIISNFVVEHVKNPRTHIKELERILKPGGYAILAGPGDVYPSHRVPYNYFNVIRYGYHQMFKENNLEMVEEYFPAKTWMSILYVIYTTCVRNRHYNKNQFTKLLQMIVLGISLVVSPFLNLVALFLDLITPFDQVGYAVYLVLLKKPTDNDPEGKSV